MTEQEYLKCYSDLKRLRLSGMAAELKHQHEQPDEAVASMEDRIVRLIQAESQIRDDKKIGRILKNACLRYPDAGIDPGIIEKQGVDRTFLNRLTECDWIDRHQNLLTTGKTGAGKSYCACALAVCAVSRFKSVKYYKASELLRLLEKAELDKTLTQELNRLYKFDLLVIDDFGLMNLDSSSCRNLFELIDSREGRKSTIFVSQLPVSAWYGLFQENTYADACLDRLTGMNSYHLEFNGDSLRTRKSGAGRAEER